MGFMMKIGDIKWVYVFDGERNEWVWLQVKIRHIGKSGMCLVDFFNSLGSSLFSTKELYDQKGGE